MKKITVALLLISWMGLFAQIQIKSDFELSNIEGKSQIINHYERLSGFGGIFYNSGIIKYSGDLSKLGIYYQRNYIREKISYKFEKKQYFIKPYFNFNLFSDNNFFAHIIGLNDRYKNSYGVSGGLDLSLNTKGIYLKANTGVNYNGYNKENATDTFSDVNSILDIKIELSEQERFRHFVRFYKYDDLNKSDKYDYHRLEIGTEFNRLFTHNIFLKDTCKIGESNLFENIPVYLANDARVTAKVAQNWMLVEKMRLEFWFEKSGKRIYPKGDNEILIQRNFKNDKNNHLSALQIGNIYDFDNNNLILKFNFKYYFSRFTGELQHRHYFANQRKIKSKTGVKITMDVYKNSYRFAYLWRIIDNNLSENEIIHTFSVEMNF